MNKTWYIESEGKRTEFTNWRNASEAWKDVKNGYLCRGDGLCLDCK